MPASRAALGAAIAICALLLAGCTEQVRGLETSMLPTVRPGELLDLETNAYDDSPPRVGDVVAMVAPKGFELEQCGTKREPDSPCPASNPELTDEGLIKRVVAVAGDTIAIAADGGVIRNGRAAYEPYVINCIPADGCALPGAITVPPGRFFVMGDNRPGSSDSRYWGPVPIEAIEGRVTPLR